MNKKKLLLLAIFIAVIGTAIYMIKAKGYGQFLTLDYLKTQQIALNDYYTENTLSVIGIYLGIYILVTALSLPGAAVMTLAGGAIFGVLVGTIVVSFASTIGATLAFLIARGLLRDWVQEKFGDKLKKINEGVKKEGAFYLFALRLVPIFPFFLINLVMGLTPIRAVVFFFVSQIGMLAGTIAYVNAGTQLSQIDSLAGILSPQILLSFAALGLLPIISKKLVSYLRRRKALAKFKKPKRFDYNMVVIGAGSGGLVSAYIAAALKAKVALIEKHKMGGDCLNTGCVPSKALIRVCKILSDAKRAKEFGLTKATVEFDFANIMEHVQDVIKQVAPHDSIERYTNLGVECIQGEAKVVSPYEVSVNGKTLTTKSIIIATGGRPFTPNIKGIDQIDYYTSDNIWELRKLPKKLLVLGTGPIGSELAQCFHRLGSEVTMVQRGTRMLPKEDEDVAELVHEQFTKEGIRVLSGHPPKEFRVTGDKKVLVCEHEGKEVEIEFDAMLSAIGRRPNVKGFGLEDIGVEYNERGNIETQPTLSTNFPNIYICGDVSASYQFTHFAAHQAWYASVNALLRPFWSFNADYSVIPWCTFTDPEVAHVGLSESIAKEKGIDYEMTKYGIDDLDRAIADVEAHGFVKVLTVPGKDKILGVTIVGHHAGDILAEFILAMKYGIGLNKILGTIHIYPTQAEANKYVAGVWKRKHAPKGALRMLEKFHRWRRG